MDILNLFLDFFGINLLNETSSFYDLLNISLSIFVAMFLVCFIIRSLFLLLKFGER